jgi:predicted esterase
LQVYGDEPKKCIPLIEYESLEGRTIKKSDDGDYFTVSTKEGCEDHSYTLIWLQDSGDNDDSDTFTMLKHLLKTLPDDCKIVIPTVPTKKSK